MNKENVLKLINNIIGECEASLKVYKIAQKRNKDKPITSEKLDQVYYRARIKGLEDEIEDLKDIVKLLNI
jgi:hypothetical protein